MEYVMPILPIVPSRRPRRAVRSQGTQAAGEVFCLERGDRPSVTMRPRTRATYCWDGSRYARSGLEQLAPGYVVQEIVDGLTCQSTWPQLRVDRFPDGRCGHSADEVDAVWGHPGLPPVAAAVYGQPGTPDERIAGDPDAQSRLSLEWDRVRRREVAASVLRRREPCRSQRPGSGGHPRYRCVS